MGLKLRALSGPVKGQTFAVKAGLKIGRSKGEIKLDDPKVSSLHAFITKVGEGAYTLNDNGSKNGIRTASGERAQTLELLPKTEFFIGASQFVVETDSPAQKERALRAISLDQDVEAASAAAPEHQPTQEDPALVSFESPAPVDSEPTKASPVVAPLAVAPLKWNEALEQFASGALDKIQDEPRPVVALEPAVTLSFTRGVQAETRWVLGYGPRQVGSEVIDLPLHEPGAPAISFEILPTPQGVTFRTNHPKEVLLNGKSVGSQLLKNGDHITVKNTRIEVELSK